LPVAATPATVWLPYLILDGKVVATDRLNEKTISRKGKQIGRWYSDKAHGFGGNIPVPVHPVRHPAVGLAGPARRRPRHHRRP
jgi:hypothetical protein